MTTMLDSAIKENRVLIERLYAAQREVDELETALKLAEDRNELLADRILELEEANKELSKTNDSLENRVQEQLAINNLMHQEQLAINNLMHDAEINEWRARLERIKKGAPVDFRCRSCGFIP
jgi:DNA repair exonuclease SbcCD ATPase subunit